MFLRLGVNIERMDFLALLKQLAFRALVFSAYIYYTINSKMKGKTALIVTFHIRMAL